MSTRKKNVSDQCVEEAADELFLTMTNDGDLYERWTKIVRGELIPAVQGKRRHREGPGDPVYLAFLPFVKDGARKYQREVGKTAFDMTSPDVIEATTQRYVNDFDTRYKAGDLAWLGGPKGSRRNPGPKSGRKKPKMRRSKIVNPF